MRNCPEEKCAPECRFDTFTLKDQGWECESTKDCFCKRFYPFGSGLLEVGPTITPERAVELVTKAKGNLHGDFVLHPGLLPENECKALMDYVDTVLEETLASQGPIVLHGKNITEDFRLQITGEELQSVISSESIQKIYKAYKDFDPEFPVQKIYIRRTVADGGTHIKYHNDGYFTVMHISLNGDELNGGGRFHYITPHAGVVQPDYATGTAIVHGHEIVHGVSSFH